MKTDISTLVQLGKTTIENTCTFETAKAAMAEANKAFKAEYKRLFPEGKGSEYRGFRKELAEKLNVSKARITQLLDPKEKGQPADPMELLSKAIKLFIKQKVSLEDITRSLSVAYKAELATEEEGNDE